MTFPKHKNPSPENAATAPYNFVPLPDKVETVKLDDLPDHDSYDTTRHTGRIEVELTTASPLYIRTGLSPELFAEIGKKSFHELNDTQKREVAKFFHSHTNPVIPGSSLRGMLRSMVEIVSYGKVQPVSDKPLVYRAVGDRTSLGDFYRTQLLGKKKAGKGMRFDYPSPNVRGGYLEKDTDGNWAIRPAKTYLGETFVHVDYQYADTVVGSTHGRQIVHNVFVEPARRLQTQRSRKNLYLDLALTNNISRTQSTSSLVPAKLVESGQMGNPHKSPGKHMHCAIYEPDTTQPLIKIPRKIWEIYEEDRDLNRGLETRKLKNVGDPLFYLVDYKGKLIFFGPTMMFRLPYTQSPADLGPKDLHQDINLTQVDFAEAMFGYVRGREVKTKIPKEKAYAGRIFVGDARLVQEPNDIWLGNNPITPKILSGPKPTSFQLYLTQQDPHNNKKLDHYAPTSPHKTVIRGHKLYWHKGPNPAIAHPALANAPVKQLTQISPLKPGVSFTFTIHFENLSDLELGALWWVLQLGSDPNYRLKLGMGKPLGMGAVSTTPTLILTDRKKRYQSLFDSNRWQTGKTDKDNTYGDKLADKFETYIRKNHTDAYSGTERIAQLISLLHFPGPTANQTEYMKLPEFKERRVLPTPLSTHPHHRKKVTKSAYTKFQTVAQTWSVWWNNKKNRSETKMPNDEIAVVNLRRKQAAKLNGQTTELVIAKIEDGVCYLEEY